MKKNIFANRIPTILLVIFLFGSTYAVLAVVDSAGAGPSVYDCEDSGNTQMNVGDCNALIAFYNETDGANWTNADTNNWLVLGKDPCDDTDGWTGVACFDDGDGERVTGLDLQNNNLTGTFPTSLYALSSLSYLHIGGNALTGGIPTDIDQLSALTALYLNENSFDGTIPDSFSNLTNLFLLYLHGNMLSGTVPQGLCDLSLANFLVSYNKLDVEAVGGANCLGTDDLTTQTVPPDPYINNITTQADDNGSITIVWQPIEFSEGSGRYEVLMSTVSGVFGSEPDAHTSTKTDNYVTLTGLNPNMTYYFVVRTRSGGNSFNSNTLLSENSAEISGTPTALTLTSFQAAGITPSILAFAALFVLLLFGTLALIRVKSKAGRIDAAP